MVIIKSILYIYEADNKLIEGAVKDIALITGPSRYCKTAEFKEQYSKFDYICFVLSENKCSSQILEFIYNNIGWLKEKKTVLFYNAHDSKIHISLCIKEIHKLLDKNLIYEDCFYFDKDELKIKKFNNKPKEYGYKLMELKEHFIKYAADIRSIMEDDIKKYPKELLKNKVEEFLNLHSTCTLCTASNDMVIGTPIEYIYENGKIYIITEGGRKFINLLRNDNVSIAVYENYSGFANLEGLQLSGIATIIDYNDYEYDEIIKLKKLDPKNIKKLNMLMNVIKIDLYRATFLSADIKKEGYEAKQVMIF
ncbi:pyridoxamine 5'-phosphate oxidase family protein [Clostridium hydrogenum]|uniref:pyridoxamine 5'-phosphate oxidase family protein n=1 Tax=Clostridium hydrogenum TaxID=2855764 RepID=UPI001F1802DE|nr:pyridoxamine 5'-phosphate oxidase family protein [Clostridium hydrogenum]